MLSQALSTPASPGEMEELGGTSSASMGELPKPGGLGGGVHSAPAPPGEMEEE